MPDRCDHCGYHQDDHRDAFDYTPFVRFAFAALVHLIHKTDRLETRMSDVQSELEALATTEEANAAKQQADNAAILKAIADAEASNPGVDLTSIRKAVEDSTAAQASEDATLPAPVVTPPVDGGDDTTPPPAAA